MLMWQHFGHDFNKKQKNASLLNYIVFGYIIFNNCYVRLFRTSSKQWLIKGFGFVNREISLELRNHIFKNIAPSLFGFAWHLNFRILFCLKICTEICVAYLRDRRIPLHNDQREWFRWSIKNLCEFKFGSA